MSERFAALSAKAEAGHNWWPSSTSLHCTLYLELFSSDAASIGSHSDFTRSVINVEGILVAVITNQTVPQLAENDGL